MEDAIFKHGEFTATVRTECNDIVITYGEEHREDTCIYLDVPDFDDLVKTIGDVQNHLKKLKDMIGG